MAAHGFNAVRLYTVPPRWLLDVAQRHGLGVMIGLPWEQHVAFLDNVRLARSIEEGMRAGVAACLGHPAVLCYSIGNEIPSSIVRWHGRHRVERYLEQLYRAVKAEDPHALVTYVNYPGTEYLQLPFLDIVSFNVYLESLGQFAPYLERLQNIAGERPLIVAEVGLDSQRNGEDVQADTLNWQVRTSFATGCAGTFVFAWTDEWYRGESEIEDWDFGLTHRDRCPKPALAAVSHAYAEVPCPLVLTWPRISIVVCTYNGSQTIRDCLDGIVRLEYRDYEIIVVDDGSSDTTAALVQEYDVRLITTENQGLSSARNTGMAAATGEIIAYLDDDARPDPHWLTYIAYTFLTTSHAAVGGPNIAPLGDNFVAECVDLAPGNPEQVLLSDSAAELLPGCNLAIRKSCLQAIGGFDPTYRIAGDDVDVCWRLRDRGWTLGYHPSAMVWHHRRRSVRAYWQQQVGYGRAEGLLAQKWPEKYNILGHLDWAGRLYGRGVTRRLGWPKDTVNYGVWGAGMFQSIHQPSPSLISSLFQMPEKYLLILSLGALSGMGLLWKPLVLVSPLLFIVVGVSIGQAVLSGASVCFKNHSSSPVVRLKRHSLVALLYLIEPLARLWGRIGAGLTPWRRHSDFRWLVPRPRTLAFWSEQWKSTEEWLGLVETALRCRKVPYTRGGSFDRWEFEVRDGLGGCSRIRMATEEHGEGRQLMRFRLWPRFSLPMAFLGSFCGLLALATALEDAWTAFAILAAFAATVAIRIYRDCSAAMATAAAAIQEVPADSVLH